jgi:hypothetical protein
MCIKLLQYHVFYTLFFHFIVILVIFPFAIFVIFLFPSDEYKTPEYVFSQVKARKTLRIFFLFTLYLSEKKKENVLFNIVLNLIIGNFK